LPSNSRTTVKANIKDAYTVFRMLKAALMDANTADMTVKTGRKDAWTAFTTAWTGVKDAYTAFTMVWTDSKVAFTAVRTVKTDVWVVFNIVRAVKADRKDASTDITSTWTVVEDASTDVTSAFTDVKDAFADFRTDKADFAGFEAGRGAGWDSERSLRGRGSVGGWGVSGYLCVRRFAGGGSYRIRIANANTPSITKVSAILQAAPTSIPIQVPTPTREAFSRSRLCTHSPISAPANGPIGIPGMPKNRPMRVPANVPRMASLLAPTRLAPSSPAKKSMASAIAVNTASTTTVATEITWKSPAHAASNIPAKTSGGPGSAGNTVPTMPARIKPADRMYASVC